MIRSLTSFRFITAFTVFLFHCTEHLAWRTDIRLLDKFLFNGATFMSGFFVLSGFIMAHVYGHTDFAKRENVFHYYIKRFAKIYPAYALTTIAFFALFPVATALWPRVIVNELFLIQGFLPSMFRYELNVVTWSLTTEMFLYFLFPLLMLLSGKSPKTLVVAIVMTALISFNIRGDNSDYIYANPVFRIADFLCGMGFYFIKDKFKDIRFKNIPLSAVVHILVVALLFIACRNLGAKTYRYMGGQFAIVPLFGLWITMVYHSRAKIYDNAVLNYLGLISYSFYLWQFIVILLGQKIMKQHPDFNLDVMVLGVFALNIVLSVLTYHLWEERLRQWIVRRYAVTSGN